MPGSKIIKAETILARIVLLYSNVQRLYGSSLPLLKTSEVLTNSFSQMRRRQVPP